MIKYLLINDVNINQIISQFDRNNSLILTYKLGVNR